jgi:hypothetical protein
MGTGTKRFVLHALAAGLNDERPGPRKTSFG